LHRVEGGIELATSRLVAKAGASRRRQRRD
jgi:hypothetical protein